MAIHTHIMFSFMPPSERGGDITNSHYPGKWRAILCVHKSHVSRIRFQLKWQMTAEQGFSLFFNNKMLYLFNVKKKKVCVGMSFFKQKWRCMIFITGLSFHVCLLFISAFTRRMNLKEASRSNQRCHVSLDGWKWARTGGTLGAGCSPTVLMGSPCLEKRRESSVCCSLSPSVTPQSAVLTHSPFQALFCHRGSIPPSQALNTSKGKHVIHLSSHNVKKVS